MMEKEFTCLVEITAVLSMLELTFQVQGGAMIGEGNLIFCTLRALSKSQNWPAGPDILAIKQSFSKRFC